MIINWLSEYKFQLKITKERTSKLGDFRHCHNNKPHRITVNHNLNKYFFLIILVHEIAHLAAWNKFKNKILSHGNEWKEEFRIHLKPFIELNVFPEDVLSELRRALINPGASSCSDVSLSKVLKKYDGNSEFVHLEDLPFGCTFRIKNGMRFIKGDKIKKRYKCTDPATKKIYLVSPVAEAVQETLF